MRLFDIIYSSLDDLDLDETCVSRIFRSGHKILAELNMREINKKYPKLTADDIFDIVSTTLPRKIKFVAEDTYSITEEEARDLGEQIGINWDEVEFTPKDLQIGFDVELEHGLVNKETNITDDDVEATAKIAWAHLKELPDYYQRLVKMEKTADEEPVIELMFSEEVMDGDGFINNDPWALANSSDIRISSNKEFFCGHVDTNSEDGKLIVSALFIGYDQESFSFDTVVHRLYRGYMLGPQLTEIAMQEFKNMQEYNPEIKLRVEVVNPQVVDFLKRRYGLTVLEEWGSAVVMGSRKGA